VKKATLIVEDAGCVSCAYAIEKVGSHTQGIRDVHVNIGRRRVTVDYEDDSAIARLVEALSRLGHDATIESSADAENLP